MFSACTGVDVAEELVDRAQITYEVIRKKKKHHGK